MPYLETLARWRSTRNSALVPELIADADVAARSAKAARQRVADPVQFHTLWTSIAEEAQPEDVPWLAATLTRKLELDMLRRVGTYGAACADRWRERSGLLLVHAPNPILTAAALRILRSGEFFTNPEIEHGDTEDIFGPVFELLARGGDTSVRADVEALLEHYAAEATTRMLPFAPYVATALTSFLASLPAAEEGAARASGGVGATMGASGFALKEAVLADPDDDGARLVYADWLTEHDDPLGEFIVLQCRIAKGTGQKKDSVRANSLLQTYKALWLGDVAKVLSHVVFRRGFLASCGLAQNAVATEHEWERLSQSPVLQTVEEIQIGRGNKRHFALFVESPQALNLRALHHVGTAESLRVASGRERRIDTLVVEAVPSPKVMTALFTSPSLPRLTRLTANLGERDAGKQLAGLAAHLAKKPLPRLKHVDCTYRPWSSDPDVFADAIRPFLALPLSSRRLSVPTGGLVIEASESGSLTITLEQTPSTREDSVLAIVATYPWSRVDVTIAAEGVHYDARTALLRLFPGAELTERL